MSTSGWECPKCHQVWGPMATACLPCNDLIHQANHRSETSDASSLVDGPTKPVLDLDHELAQLTLLDAAAPLVSMYRTWARDSSTISSSDRAFVLANEQKFAYLSSAFDGLKKYHVAWREVVYGAIGDAQDHPAILRIHGVDEDQELYECVTCGQLWRDHEQTPACTNGDLILTDLSGMTDQDFTKGQPLFDERDQLHHFQKIVHARDGDEGGILVTSGVVLPSHSLRTFIHPARRKPMEKSKIMKRRVPPLRKTAKKTARRKT